MFSLSQFVLEKPLWCWIVCKWQGGMLANAKSSKMKNKWRVQMVSSTGHLCHLHLAASAHDFQLVSSNRSTCNMALGSRIQGQPNTFCYLRIVRNAIGSTLFHQGSYDATAVQKKLLPHLHQCCVPNLKLNSVGFLLSEKLLSGTRLSTIY